MQTVSFAELRETYLTELVTVPEQCHFWFEASLTSVELSNALHWRTTLFRSGLTNGRGWKRNNIN